MAISARMGRAANCIGIIVDKRVDGFSGRIVQVIYNERLIAFLQQFHQDMGTDISGAAGN